MTPDETKRELQRMFEIGVQTERKRIQRLAEKATVEHLPGCRACVRTSESLSDFLVEVFEPKTP